MKEKYPEQVFVQLPKQLVQSQHLTNEVFEVVDLEMKKASCSRQYMVLLMQEEQASKLRLKLDAPRPLSVRPTRKDINQAEPVMVLVNLHEAYVEQAKPRDFEKEKDEAARRIQRARKRSLLAKEEKEREYALVQLRKSYISAQGLDLEGLGPVGTTSCEIDSEDELHDEKASEYSIVKLRKSYLLGAGLGNQLFEAAQTKVRRNCYAAVSWHSTHYSGRLYRSKSNLPLLHAGFGHQCQNGMNARLRVAFDSSRSPFCLARVAYAFQACVQFPFGSQNRNLGMTSSEDSDLA